MSKEPGTGHILQDLLSSTVLLSRSNFIPRNFPLEIDEHNSSPEFSSCSICSESKNLRPFAVQEMEILAKFVLSREQISLILQTEDHPPIFCCKICSSAILSLAKLSTQIENITISLRTVISSRNGLFNKLRNESKICEIPHQVVTRSVRHADNENDNRLSGRVEEEFFVKVEPTCGDDCQDNLNDGDISDADIAAVSKETAGPVPQKQKSFSCPTCDESFTSHFILRRHKRVVHPLRCKCTLCPEIFAGSNLLRRHMHESHNSLETRHSCAVCLKTFSLSTKRDRHVELVHKTTKYPTQLMLKNDIFKALDLPPSRFVQGTNSATSYKRIGPKEFQCLGCKKIYGFARSAIQHAKTCRELKWVAAPTSTMKV